MGNYFKSKRKVLDLVLSSPSKRTKETLEHFFNKTSQNIIFNETIYHSSEQNIYSVIKDVEIPPNEAAILVDGRLVLEKTPLIVDKIFIEG